MKAKVQEKEDAIRLRQKGYSYIDILREIPVAKSTLSGWLKDLPLTDEEKLSLKKRKDGNINRGRIKSSAALRRNRLNREKIVLEEAKIEFKNSYTEPFFQVGIALYWAEGSKTSNLFAFTNSDPEMIFLMIRWIKRFLGVNKNDLILSLYIHKPYAHENLEDFWSEITGISTNDFNKTIYKATNFNFKKRPSYKGCLRIRVRKSRSMLLKMKMWQNMLTREYRKS